MSIELKKLYTLKIGNRKQEEYEEKELIELRDNLLTMFPLNTVKTPVQRKYDREWIETANGYKKGGKIVTHRNIARIKECLDAVTYKTVEKIAVELSIGKATTSNALRYLFDTGVVVRTRHGARGKHEYRIKVIEHRPQHNGREKISVVPESIRDIKTETKEKRFQFRDK